MSFSGPGLWYATRAAGLVTLLLLTATTALGLLTAGRVSTMRWPRFLVIGLHRNISLLALAFLGVHIGTTVVDSYTSIGIQDAVIPFLSGYHRLWLGLGAIASDVLIAVSVTSALRQRIGHRSWRAVHWCGYLCWPIAMAHGLEIGTDRSQTWVFVLAMACGAAVLVAGIVRGLDLLPSHRMAR
ncbi:MAG TPA: ferric reductase-like transmembrane domain-containing protein [Streptosporangiaceae bacterium]|jgi:sulfoxide reductase heme-binding subunit YedZ|nr:ferric reductase-like transmembrane domain-containing protein [Streptosporangiaceae bacterium]